MTISEQQKEFDALVDLYQSKHSSDERVAKVTGKNRDITIQYLMPQFCRYFVDSIEIIKNPDKCTKEQFDDAKEIVDNTKASMLEDYNNLIKKGKDRIIKARVEHFHFYAWDTKIITLKCKYS